jgi:protein-disulfide isomerase/uncharacterized membrane protein
MPDFSTLKARLGTRRPILDRVLFGLALLGVLVAVHLLIQQGRGFDRGCLGFSEPAAAAQASTFNCEMVTQSGAGTLLGLSNAWWGIGFYLAVAGLSVAAAALERQRLRFAATRALLIGGGLLYSAYLTYHQFAGLGALCALCLTSAGIALALFLVQGAMLVGPLAALGSSDSSKQSMDSTSSFRPVRWAAAALGLLVLIGADVAYFSSLDVASPEPAAAAQASSESSAPMGKAAPTSEKTPARSRAAVPSPSADTTEEKKENAALPSGCRFAPGAEQVETSRLVSFGDPVFGKADAPVTVVEFFDPNCPHCKTFNTTMKNLTEQYGDQARFVYKPIPLWRRSVNQIAALHAAAKQGQFKAMLDAQFARQQRGGFTDEQLAEIAREIGMNPDPMLTQIQQGAYQQQIQRDRRLAKQAGVSGTPAVVINGRRVARRAKNAQCLEALIEREIERS